METNRFQVSDQKCGEHIAQSKAIDIARRYITVLPHVRYTAVGINFRRLVEIAQPDDFIKDRFLKKGRWNKGHNGLLGLSLKFVYEHEDGRLNLALESGAFEVKEGGTNGETPWCARARQLPQRLSRLSHGCSGSRPYR